MYDDPAHIRDNPIKVRFNDAEWAVVRALARFNGRQPAAFVRELVMSSVTRAEHEQQVTEQHVTA
jgi:hypothetical protein